MYAGRAPWVRVRERVQEHLAWLQAGRAVSAVGARVLLLSGAGLGGSMGWGARALSSNTESGARWLLST